MLYQVQSQFPAQKLSSFRIPAILDYYTELFAVEEIPLLLRDAHRKHHEILPVGEGTNIIWGNSRIKKFGVRLRLSKIRVHKNHHYARINAEAGLVWDDLVAYTVNEGWWGLESLSGIPGTVGATPIQNVGAYGTEIKDVCAYVDAVHLYTGKKRRFLPHECTFGYRTSRFNSQDKGKYIITNVAFNLTRTSQRPLYPSIEKELSILGVKANPMHVRLAVIKIRNEKLPHYKVIPNCGSFFKNPHIPISQAVALRKKYPEMPFFESNDGLVKIPAGWLIDTLGWKGKKIGSLQVYEKNALVLTNPAQIASPEEVQYAEEILKKSVLSHFGILLEREPELIQ
jgi:UDP-N-acetylmuramate dehydrogenase